MPRVLITGAAGFIGMHTAICFLKEGWEVIGLDNFNDYYSVSLKNDRTEQIVAYSTKNHCNFKMIKADINSNIWSTLANYKFDALIHLAAQAGVRYSVENPKAYLESNILGFQEILDFVKNQKILRFIYASSSSVYGMDSTQPFTEDQPCNNPKSYYAATKKTNEMMAMAYNSVYQVSSIGLRFFTVYGPWGRPDMAPMIFASAAFSKKPIRVFNFGKQSRDFTYVDDIVTGIYKLIEIKNFPTNALICNIGNGSPVKLMDFICEIERQTERELQKEYVKAQLGDVETTYANTSLLTSLTAYKPEIELSEGINRFINWYREYFGI